MERETMRLRLRPFREGDAEAVHAYAGNPENLTYMLFGPNRDLEETRAFVRMAMARAKENPCRDYHFAVLLKGSGALIGGCSLTLQGEDEGEVGWLLHRDHWDRGYGTELGRALLELGFGELGLRRVTAGCDAQNIASYRVMEHLGMRREACYRQTRRANGLAGPGLRDELCYALLREEWAWGPPPPPLSGEERECYARMFRYVRERLRENGGERGSFAPCRLRSEHIRRVAEWAERLAAACRQAVDLDALRIAALFHDAGYRASGNEDHAARSAEIFARYAVENGMAPDRLCLIRELIAGHSDKSALRAQDAPIERILLLEADLLDEKGALSIVLDTLRESENETYSYESVCRHVERFSAKILSENPLTTPEARAVWARKQALTEDFIRQLRLDLKPGRGENGNAMSPSASGRTGTCSCATGRRER